MFVYRALDCWYFHKTYLSKLLKYFLVFCALFFATITLLNTFILMNKKKLNKYESYSILILVSFGSHFKIKYLSFCHLWLVFFPHSAYSPMQITNRQNNKENSDHKFVKMVAIRKLRSKFWCSTQLKPQKNDILNNIQTCTITIEDY